MGIDVQHDQIRVVAMQCAQLREGDGPVSPEAQRDGTGRGDGIDRCLDPWIGLIDLARHDIDIAAIHDIQGGDRVEPFLFRAETAQEGRLLADCGRTQARADPGLVRAAIKRNAEDREAAAGGAGCEGGAHEAAGQPVRIRYRHPGTLSDRLVAVHRNRIGQCCLCSICLIKSDIVRHLASTFQNEACFDGHRDA